MFINNRGKIKKRWNIMENYSTIKKNGIMPFATTWMVLEFIILSEVAKKYKYHMISLFVESKRNK